ncbi:MAG: hypothetical protein Q7J84_05725 [Sulfuricaulis sp.]|nr:hypothetical protein [Sulfuricaulis sp.]
MTAPADWRAFGLMLLISLAATAAETAPPPDMNLIEFLGSVETDAASGTEVLTAIDTELLPELPEELPYETK